MPLVQHSRKIYGVEVQPYGVLIGLRTKDDYDSLWFMLAVSGDLTARVPVLMTDRTKPHRLYLISTGPALYVALLLNGFPILGTPGVYTVKAGSSVIVPLRFDEAGEYTLAVMIGAADGEAAGADPISVVLIQVNVIPNGESLGLMKPTR